MNDLGGVGAGRGNPIPTPTTAETPVGLSGKKPDATAEQLVGAGPNLSSGSSAKESVSESDKYWLWWTRRANKMEDEEAAAGPHSRNRSREPHQ